MLVGIVLWLLFANTPQAVTSQSCETVNDGTVTVDTVAVPYCRDSGWERETGD